MRQLFFYSYYAERSKNFQFQYCVHTLDLPCKYSADRMRWWCNVKGTDDISHTLGKVQKNHKNSNLIFNIRPQTPSATKNFWTYTGIKNSKSMYVIVCNYQIGIFVWNLPLLTFLNIFFIYQTTLEDKRKLIFITTGLSHRNVTLYIYHLYSQYALPWN